MLLYACIHFHYFYLGYFYIQTVLRIKIESFIIGEKTIYSLNILHFYRLKMSI